MIIPLRVLIIEDSEFDTQLLVSLLKKGGYQPLALRVETESELREALTGRQWDIVLADYNLPQFSAPAALEILQATALDLPFIIVSGGIGESTAVEAMKMGAHDYLMKGNLARLVPAVQRELREAENRAAKRQTKDALQESELRYRLLWETATDAILLIDPHGMIQFANPAVETLLGSPSELLLGKPLSHLAPPRLRNTRNSLQEQLERGYARKQWDPIESVLLREDGTEIVVDVVFSQMELEGKSWFVGFIRDVTARKQAESALRDTTEQLRVAREIQQHLFPRKSPQISGFEIAGASFPAEETGGDYFDYILLKNGHTAVVVGDVTGHGVGPALLMAETRAYLRVLARHCTDPGDILTQANLVLSEDVGAERFVTIFLACLDCSNRALSFVNAGHTPAYILAPDGKVKGTLKRSGVPLGIRPDTAYPCSRAIPLTLGDIVIILTDGLEEATDPDDNFYGTDRVLDIVHGNRSRPAREIVDLLYKSVRSFTGEAMQTDDLTLVIIKVTE